MRIRDQPNTILDDLESDNWQLLYRCRWDADHRAATIPILKSLLTQDDLAIKQRAMRAVARIGHCDRAGALAALVAPLAESVTHPDELTRHMAVGTLFAVGADNPQVAVPALITACDHDVLLTIALHALIEIGRPAHDAALTFRRCAAHHDGKIRRLAMRGLGAIGADDPESLAVLRDGRSDRNKRVREMAQKALTGLGG